MEYLIVGLVGLNILLVLFVLISRERTKGEMGNQVLSTLVDYQDKQRHYQSQEFAILRENLEKSLGDGLEKSRQTLGQVMERLVKVDLAQKQISSLSENVVSLQNVLTDKKTRGIFGEIQLKQILTQIFGEGLGKTYDLQKTLSNSKISDAILYLPEPLGVLAVDAKFPLENYRKMVDGEMSEDYRNTAKKEFNRNLKKHIDDIGDKYIIKGETSDQAILFLPAEAIFAEVHAYHLDIVEYAAKKRVWLCSPTTLMAILTTVQALLTNIERNKHIDKIHLEVNKLGEEFQRFDERWDDFDRHLSTVFKDVEKIGTTRRKLSEKFSKIINL